MLNFDHDNDTQYNGYLLYQNKLINARTYEVLVKNNIKILLPVNFDMNRKNRILDNRKDFSEYKLNFKEYRYIDGYNSLLGINKALKLCETTFKIKALYINVIITLFGFQVFTRKDLIDILEQSKFKNAITIFHYLNNKGFLLRIDDLPVKTNVEKRVYSFTDKGFSVVKMFYDTLENSTVFDFKFKSKKELLVDSILKKYKENG